MCSPGEQKRPVWTAVDICIGKVRRIALNPSRAAVTQGLLLYIPACATKGDKNHTALYVLGWIE